MDGNDLSQSALQLVKDSDDWKTILYFLNGTFFGGHSLVLGGVTSGDGGYHMFPLWVSYILGGWQLCELTLDC